MNRLARYNALNQLEEGLFTGYTMINLIADLATDNTRERNQIKNKIISGLAVAGVSVGTATYQTMKTAVRWTGNLISQIRSNEEEDSIAQIFAEETGTFINLL